MRLIAGTSDIFGKLPPGLPGSRFAVDQEMFGLDGRKRKKKTPVKVVEDHDEVPDVPSSSFVPPKGQGRRRLPGYSPDDDGGMFGYFGQEATAPAATTTPPATTPPAAAASGGGASAKTETNWVAIGIGVAVVAGIIALIMYSKKPAAGGMGNVGKGESKKARKFISKQTRKLVKAGLSRSRAAAAAYNMARQKHFKVSPKPH